MAFSKAIVVCLIYFCVLITNAYNAERRHHIDFLENSITILNHSNKVVTHLCWKKADLVLLSKTLSNNFVSHRFPKDTFDDSSKIFVLNVSCAGSLEIITEGIRNNLFDLNFLWMIFDDGDDIKVHNFNFALNSLVYIVGNAGANEFSIKNIFKLSAASLEYDVVDIGKWKPSRGFEYFNKISLSKNRTNLKGSAIRVSYVLSDNASLSHLWDYREIYTDKLTKANYIIISYMLEFLNSSKIDVWTDTWGYRNEVSKLYNGMYGDLVQGRADLAGTTGIMQVGRLQHFKFIPPTSPARVLLIFQAPPLSFTTNIFTLPFSSAVWIALFLLIMLSASLIYFVLVIEWKLKICPDNQRIERRPRISDVVLLECSALSQRSGQFEPQSFSGRLIVQLIFILCFYMYTGFSGYILILLQSTTESINDMVSLYESKMDIGVEDTPYNRYYFITPNDDSNETYRKLFYENRIAPKNNWLTPRDGIRKVKEGFFGFHVESGSAFLLIKDFTENEKCKIRDVKSIFDTGDVFLAVPRNSSYSEIFLVRRIFETGLQKREHQKFFASKPQCIGRQGNYDSVRFLDCYFPFLILGSGLVISCLILVIEIFLVGIDKINNK